MRVRHFRRALRELHDLIVASRPVAPTSTLQSPCAWAAAGCCACRGVDELQCGDEGSAIVIFIEIDFSVVVIVSLWSWSCPCSSSSSSSRHARSGSTRRQHASFRGSTPRVMPACISRASSVPRLRTAQAVRYHSFEGASNLAVVVGEVL